MGGAALGAWFGVNGERSKSVGTGTGGGKRTNLHWLRPNRFCFERVLKNLEGRGWVGLLIGAAYTIPLM